MGKLTLRFYEEHQISQSQGDDRFEESFLYDQTDPDKLGIGHITDEEITAIAGANHNEKYTWEIGVEIIGNHHSKGIATDLVKVMTN